MKTKKNFKTQRRIAIMDNSKIRVISNPVVMQNLCTMRDKNTDSQGVRIATRKITASRALITNAIAVPEISMNGERKHIRIKS